MNKRLTIWLAVALAVVITNWLFWAFVPASAKWAVFSGVSWIAEPHQEIYQRALRVADLAEAFGAHDVALLYYHKALADMPENDPARSDILERLGGVEMIANNHAIAIDYYSQALESLPSNSDPGRAIALHRQRGYEYLEIAKNKEALEDFNELISEDPTDALGYRLRGEALEKLGRTDDARTAFMNSLELENEKASKSRSSILSIAFLHRKLGMNKFALQEYNEITQNDPSFAAYYNQGNMYMDSNNYDKAIQSFTEAIVRAPKNSSAFFNRGLSYLKTGELDPALSDFTAAIRIDPKKRRAYINRGYVFELKRQVKFAHRDYVRAAEMGMPDMALRQAIKRTE